LLEQAANINLASPRTTNKWCGVDQLPLPTAVSGLVKMIH